MCSTHHHPSSPRALSLPGRSLFRIFSLVVLVATIVSAAFDMIKSWLSSPSANCALLPGSGALLPARLWNRDTARLDARMREKRTALSYGRSKRFVAAAKGFLQQSHCGAKASPACRRTMSVHDVGARCSVPLRCRESREKNGGDWRIRTRELENKPAEPLPTGLRNPNSLYVAPSPHTSRHLHTHTHIFGGVVVRK